MVTEFSDRIPAQLKESLLHGKGAAEIQWHADGAFARCQAFLREHGVPGRMIDGECANLYHAANGRWPGAHKEHGLTAAAEVHTGAMIALIPAAQDAERLAMPGGEPVEELHVTLCYLGAAADYDTQERLSLAASIAQAFRDQAPMEGDAFAPAYFNAGNPDIETALVYLVGGRDMERSHATAGLAAYNMFAPKIPDQHKPWVAHVTAAYTDDLDAHRGLVANLGPITFDRVRLAFGGQVIDIPLEVVVDEPLGDVDVGEVDPVTAVQGEALMDQEFQAAVGSEAPVETSGDVDMTSLIASMGVYAPVRWRGPLAPIGSPTGDRRIFNPGAIEQATFPQPLRWQPVGQAGHDGAVTVAVISHAEEGTWNGTPHIVGEGYFLDPEIIPEVTQALHLVENGVSGPSVDLDSFAAKAGEYRGQPILVVQEARQRAATLVAIPAFADLRLTLEYPDDGGTGFTAAASTDVEFATTSTHGWDTASIAPRSATFDADDAVKRIQAWAGIGTDQADEPKFRSMFLWAKPEQLDQDNVPLGSAGYRLPWGDIFDGKPYLVYHAVYAASALLEGGHGGLPNIPDSDKSKLRNTITKIYARFSEAFNDPNVRASWDAGEAASMELETFAGDYKEAQHPRDPGGKDGGEWVKTGGVDDPDMGDDDEEDDGDGPDDEGPDDDDKEADNSWEDDPYGSARRFPAAYVDKYGPVTDESQVGETDLTITTTEKGAFHVARGEKDRTVPVELTPATAKSLSDLIYETATDEDEGEEFEHRATGTKVRRDSGNGIIIDWPDGSTSKLDEDDMFELQEGLTLMAQRFRKAAKGAKRTEASTMGLETFAVRGSGWSSLPTSTGAWDEGTARAALDAWADGDMSKYARGFLWFDEANRENRTAYKFPIAKPVNGKLTIFLSAVNNAEARLSSASIPAADKAKILAVLNGIQERYHSAATGGLETFAAQFGTLYPSKRSFARRDLKGPTKPVVSADGAEYYGHLALWDTCHLGHSGSGVCQRPVHSKVDYKHFYTGTVRTSEGEIIEVGKIMGDGLHAATKRGMSASAVKRYYEDTSKTFGLVRLYKDQWGIQFSGVPVPGVTEELAQKMRYSEISAHWHPIGGHLEVVAAIAVNRPAFGITASAATEDLVVDDSTIVLVEDGVQTGLIASAVFTEEAAPMAAGDEEDCGCGSGSKEQELRVARIMAFDPIPTHAELMARQARLDAHLGG